MPAVPRIQRSVPHGPVVRAREPIPVVATIHWHGGRTSQEQALAVAWTRTEVEIRWVDPWGGEQVDWVPARDVRRPGQPAPGHGTDESRPPVPRSRGGKRRW